ncbi:hypothetical protein ABZX30_07045 [Streptomyces sp. NPDC004542]|uniref:hypothetical protein n=1 Tax=Streptomyces sp. NPDC004542 TaxID=3154281 RepID=UPI0033B5DAC5
MYADSTDEVIERACTGVRPLLVCEAAVIGAAVAGVRAVRAVRAVSAALRERVSAVRHPEPS